MIAFDEALAIVFAHARPRCSETVPITQAAGRVLAEPCVARVDSPPADVSAMDGYAVRDADISGGPFERIGAAYPGAAFDGIVGAGQCVRIFTGAPLPRGADRIILQEIVREENGRVTLAGPVGANRHVRPRGLDFRDGDLLLDQGRRLDPRALVAAAGADAGAVSVWRRPKVSVISTGDELIEPGRARDHPGRIPESGSFGVAALAAAWGADVVDRQCLADDILAMRAGAMAALDCADLVVIIGGASVGERDYARRTFLELGAELLFAKVAIMPGKPVWFARKDERLILGLPGNPGSAMVTARLFLAPLLRGLGGQEARQALRWQQMPAAAPLPATGDRETFVRAHRDTEGAYPVAHQDSGMQRILASADLLVRRPARAGPVCAGEEVAVIDF